MYLFDLFSGIGGFALGFQRAGITPTAFCEIANYPAAVLKARWPEVPIFSDIRSITYDSLKEAQLPTINIISAGFPCQDISSAGRQRGINADRSGLWREVLRIAAIAHPDFIVLENVANLILGNGGRWMHTLLSALADLGYDAEWRIISAFEFGAPHLRERVWIVAYPSRQRRQMGSLLHFEAGDQSHALTKTCALDTRCATLHAIEQRMGESAICRSDDGIPNRMDRLEACGNAVYPAITEFIGRRILEAHHQSI